jgi:hypothetical protein
MKRKKHQFSAIHTTVTFGEYGTETAYVAAFGKRISIRKGLQLGAVAAQNEGDIALYKPKWIN